MQGEATDSASSPDNARSELAEIELIARLLANDTGQKFTQRLLGAVADPLVARFVIIEVIAA